MTRFQYQILQYRPFAFPGEWVAVGVLAYAPQDGRLLFAETRSTRRARGLFAGLELEGLREQLKQITARFRALAKGFEVGDANVIPSMELRDSDISSVSARVLPPNDASLRFGVAVDGLDVDLQSFFNDLRHRVLEAHLPKSRVRIDDKALWKQRFVDPIGDRALRGFAPNYAVATGINPVSFDLGFQNGRLHLIEPSSFDMEHDSIASKLERRYGRYSMLAGAPGRVDFKVYVPLYIPDGSKDRGAILKAFEPSRFGPRVEVARYEPQDVARLRADLLEIER